jgi:murein L,D-transpeptidase YcbB/YkuD
LGLRREKRIEDAVHVLLFLFRSRNLRGIGRPYLDRDPPHVAPINGKEYAAHRGDPKFAFRGVKTRHKLTIRPGPNNPVGLVWIDLTAPSYGIHGTPSPEKISRTESHGCIRLTNWDALDLAAMVSRGTIVDFQG